MARKDREDRDEELIDGEDREPRVYELGFHLDPELSSEEVKKTYQSIKDAVEKNGTLVAEGESEKIQLAYTISRQETSGRRDFNSAHFAWLVYETTPEKHEEVLSAVKENPQIVRFIDLITTKDAARHAAEMRLMKAQEKPEKEEKEEGVSDEALDAALEAAAQ
jgi:ribosomal protein S6